MVLENVDKLSDEEPPAPVPKALPAPPAKNQSKRKPDQQSSSSQAAPKNDGGEPSEPPTKKPKAKPKAAKSKPKESKDECQPETTAAEQEEHVMKRPAAPRKKPAASAPVSDDKPLLCKQIPVQNRQSRGYLGHQDEGKGNLQGRGPNGLLFFRLNAKRLVIFCVGFWGRQPQLVEPLCFLHEVKPQEGVPPEKIEEIAVLWLELPIAIRVLIVCVLLRNAQSGGCPTRVCEGSNGSTGYRPCCALPSSCLWGGLLDCCSSNTQSQSGFVDLYLVRRQ